MSYKQLKPFNRSKAGKKAGWCLQNVRLGYGIGPRYATAIQAWNNTHQNKNRSVPAGVDVPLYYSYKTDGHVNVRLSDGRVWSDGNLYSSIDAYLKGHPSVHYLGWSESVDGVAVIKVSPVSKVVYYIVRKGDTLSKLARASKTTVAALAKLNKIKNVNLIRIGQKLRLK